MNEDRNMSSIKNNAKLTLFNHKQDNISHGYTKIQPQFMKRKYCRDERNWIQYRKTKYGRREREENYPVHPPRINSMNAVTVGECEMQVE